MKICALALGLAFGGENCEGPTKALPEKTQKGGQTYSLSIPSDCVETKSLTLVESYWQLLCETHNGGEAYFRCLMNSKIWERYNIIRNPQ